MRSTLGWAELWIEGGNGFDFSSNPVNCNGIAIGLSIKVETGMVVDVLDCGATAILSAGIFAS